MSEHDGSRSLASQEQSGQSWGIAAVERIATIPFAVGGQNDTDDSFVPMLFFENDFVFLRGMEGGVHLLDFPNKKIQISGISRLRFVDIPTDAQQSSDLDPIDFGFQLRYHTGAFGTVDVEVMSDREFRFHGNIRLKKVYSVGNWELTPSATARYKDSDFNTVYYALSEFYDERIGGGLDFSAGLGARYHVGLNFHLLGSASVTRLDHQAYQSRAVEDRVEAELFFGVGWFEGQETVYRSTLDSSPYVRIAHGWATPSNIGEIVTLQTEKDPHNHQLTSLFYGHPLADDLLGLPIDIYLTPGIAHHWASSQQSSSTEYVAAIKAYHTFEWPTQWRFGVAEGLSYIDNVTHIEAAEMKEKGYKPSRLLNYLDFSFDVNIGSLLDRPDLGDVWAGYSLHHRSGIFEKSAQYGNIKGGSNYNTFYLQFDF